jgi:hypothetical protein
LLGGGVGEEGADEPAAKRPRMVASSSFLSLSADGAFTPVAPSQQNQQQVPDTRDGTVTVPRLAYRNPDPLTRGSASNLLLAAGLTGGGSTGSAAVQAPSTAVQHGVPAVQVQPRHSVTGAVDAKGHVAQGSQQQPPTSDDVNNGHHGQAHGAGKLQGLNEGAGVTGERLNRV